MACVKRVAVGMSGGVDSSVAALLVTEMGHEALGVTMRIYGGELGSGGAANACYGPDEEKDVDDARGICKTLGIPFREVDLRAEYKELVLDYFRSEYRSGRTPNPCVRCNQLIKFGLLFEKLVRESRTEIDLFATGHYARVAHDPARGGYVLRKAVDRSKDQSYFLCMLSQAQLARALFPLGGLTKAEVREMARARGLFTHDKADSQDFAGADYRTMLAEGTPERGCIKNARGETLGTHAGVWSYTVGQRRGLGIAHTEPLYVTGLDEATNTVFVGHADELYAGNLLASRVSWAGVEPPRAPFRAAVRIRYRHEEAGALVTPAEDGSARVAFDEPQRSIAAGQWAVFYEGDVLLGGGVIEKGW